MSFINCYYKESYKLSNYRATYGCLSKYSIRLLYVYVSLILWKHIRCSEICFTTSSYFLSCCYWTVSLSRCEKNFESAFDFFTMWIRRQFARNTHKIWLWDSETISGTFYHRKRDDNLRKSLLVKNPFQYLTKMSKQRKCLRIDKNGEKK